MKNSLNFASTCLKVVDTRRELPFLSASKILSKGVFANLYGLSNGNRVCATTRIPPLIISGLKVRNAALLYELCHTALDCLACKWHVFKFVRLRPTGAISEANLFYSDMDYCSQFGQRFNLKNSKCETLFMRPCLVLPYLARTKLGVVGLRRLRARA